jgi:hypothetical protein
MPAFGRAGLLLETILSFALGHRFATRSPQPTGTKSELSEDDFLAART